MKRHTWDDMKSLMKTAGNNNPRKWGGFRHWLARQQAQAQRAGYPFDIIWDELGKQVTIAHINHGRWVVTCECGGAEIVDPGDVVFYCLSCQNITTGGRLRPVVFPVNRAAIENVLSKRPNDANRNWNPGETIQQLQTENKAHGLEE